MKNSTEQIKNSMGSLNNRMSEKEERVSELEDITCTNSETGIWKRNGIKS